MSFPAYAEYKDSGVEWLGEVPAGWEVTRLGSQFAERRETVNDTDYPPLSVTKKGIVPQLENAAKTDAKDNRKRVAVDDFVINSRSDRKNSAGVSSYDGSVSLIYTVLQPPQEVDPNFIHYLLRTTEFAEEFYRYGHGIVADLWTSRYSEMKAIMLAMPPQTEQRAIASFLDRETAKIDAAVAAQERLIALLAEKRAATTSHAVTKGLDPDATMKDSGIEWIGQIPAHWEAKRLRFLCKIETGDGDTQDAVKDGEYPFFVRSPNVETINRYSFDCEAVMTSGDGAGVGKIYHHFAGKFTAHQRVYVFHEFDGILPRLVYHYFKSYFARVTLQGTAKSTVESLRRPLLADFWIVVPDESEQDAVLEYCDGIDRKYDDAIARCQDGIHLLKERRAALVSAAVTGKIDVRGEVYSKEQEAA